jgi:hypothetical protein
VKSKLQSSIYSIEAKPLNQFPLLPNKPILPASRKSKSFLIALAISLGLFSAPLLQAQGCIVARSPDEDVRTPVDWLLQGRAGPAPPPLLKRY